MFQILIWALVIAIVAGLLYVIPLKNQFKKFFHTTTTAETIGGQLEMLDKNLGETKPVCPYCQASIKEMPENNMGCPSCGEYIYKRKRPYDQEEILVTEDQLEEVREQWAIVNGEHDQYLREQKRKKQIARESGEASRVQIHRQFLEEQARELEQEESWGMARNKILETAEYLYSNSQYREALQAYLEVCYWDANGPQNLNAGRRSTADRKPFSPKVALLSPGIIRSIADLMEKEGLALRDIKRMYLETAKETYARLNDDGTELPQNPEQAWEEFEESVT